MERGQGQGRKYAPAQEPPWQALAKGILRQADAVCQCGVGAGVRGQQLGGTEHPAGGGGAQAQRRTPKYRGPKPRMALASRFETWQARVLTPFVECLKLLRQTPLPQI